MPSTSHFFAPKPTLNSASSCESACPSACVHFAFGWPRASSLNAFSAEGTSTATCWCSSNGFWMSLWFATVGTSTPSAKYRSTHARKVNRSRPPAVPPPVRCSRSIVKSGMSFTGCTSVAWPATAIGSEMRKGYCSECIFGVRNASGARPSHNNKLSIEMINYKNVFGNDMISILNFKSFCNADQFLPLYKATGSQERGRMNPRELSISRGCWSQLLPLPLPLSLAVWLLLESDFSAWKQATSSGVECSWKWSAIFGRKASVGESRYSDPSLFAGSQ